MPPPMTRTALRGPQFGSTFARQKPAARDGNGNDLFCALVDCHNTRWPMPVARWSSANLVGQFECEGHRVVQTVDLLREIAFAVLKTR